jgi:hypothetical protein
MLRRRRASRVVDFQHRARDYESCSAVWKGGLRRPHEIRKSLQGDGFA